MVYLICIISYLVLLGGIAIWKSREVKDQSDFAVAGRSLSPGMMVCTMLAVWMLLSFPLGFHDLALQSYLISMESIYLTPYVYLGLFTLFLLEIMHALTMRNVTGIAHVKISWIKDLFVQVGLCIFFMLAQLQDKSNN